MDWTTLHDTLNTRSDVGAVCRGVGHDTLDGLLAASAVDAVADAVVHELVLAGPLGVEVALLVMSPALERAASGLRAWTGENVVELIASACWERLERGALPRRPTRSVVSQARKQVVRQLRSSWKHAQAEMPILDQVVASSANVEAEVVERMAEEDLIGWVMSVAELDDQTARILVKSRALGVSMDVVAEAEGLAYHAAYRRRARAEKKIRSCVQSASPALTMEGV